MHNHIKQITEIMVQKKAERILQEQNESPVDEDVEEAAKKVKLRK